MVRVLFRAFVSSWPPLRACRGLDARRDEHRERVAGLSARRRRPRTSRSPAAVSSRASSSSRNPSDDRRAWRAPIPRRAPEIEDEHAAARHRDPRRFGHGARRILRVVQRLRQERDVDRLVLDRQLLELAALPHDVRDAAAPARAPARGRARSSDRSTAITRSTPTGRLRSSGTPRRTRDRRP